MILSQSESTHGTMDSSSFWHSNCLRMSYRDFFILIWSQYPESPKCRLDEGEDRQSLREESLSSSLVFLGIVSNLIFLSSHALNFVAMKNPACWLLDSSSRLTLFLALVSCHSMSFSCFWESSLMRNSFPFTISHLQLQQENFWLPQWALDTKRIHLISPVFGTQKVTLSSLLIVWLVMTESI